MKYDLRIHHRRSIRLTHYDYALPGAYFVTLCGFNRMCIFGHVVEDRMDENECGKIAREQWLESACIRQELELDAFTVMPNHLHGILWILGPKGEHVLMNSGFVMPDADQSFAGLNAVQPVVGPNRVRPNVGPNGIRPSVGPNGIRPRPSAARPYIFTPGRTQFGLTNPIPPMRPHSLASWAGAFKSAVTSRIRKLWNQPRAAVWQEDYFERIIRDDDELFNIREYILSNPAHWNLDRENPEVATGSEEEWPWNPDDGT
jgi:REP element-mobilizing transposase RayT